MDGRLTITDVAKSLGVTTRTIMRWEKTGKIRKPKRDWRGWRFYYKQDLEEIKRFFEACYQYNEEERTMMDISQGVLSIMLAGLLAVSGFSGTSYAEGDFNPGVAEASTEAPEAQEAADAEPIYLDQLPAVGTAEAPLAEAVKYTLGPNDVIEIDVRRHPEFSGQYTINSEGKIEYKFVGDIIVSGLTKTELNERLTEILSEYIREPEIDVRIVEYLSKVFYVVGDVNHPGKFFMKGNTVRVREALVQSGLPTEAASLRACRLITPDTTGKDNYVKVNAYNLLYKGDLTENLEMKPNDVFYVPSTMMAKFLRVISPVTNATGQAVGVAATGAAF